jgi:hypothetical protein
MGTTLSLATHSKQLQQPRRSKPAPPSYPANPISFTQKDWPIPPQEPQRASALAPHLRYWLKSEIRKIGEIFRARAVGRPGFVGRLAALAFFALSHYC